MCLVPATGALRWLYERAQTDIEYESANFWRAYLQDVFWEDEYYQFSETSPDGSRRRVDICVAKYIEGEGVTPILWVECKRPSGSAVKVEKQAFDAGTRYLEKYRKKEVHTFTTIGTSFRAWIIEQDNPKLGVIFGGAVQGKKKGYIDASWPEARELSTVLESIKRNSRS